MVTSSSYKVELDLSVWADRPEYKVMYHNKTYDLWLTYSRDRFKTIEEANKYIKKLK